MHAYILVVLLSLRGEMFYKTPPRVVMTQYSASESTQSISPSNSASHSSFAYYNGIVGNTYVADGALILRMIT